MCDVKCFSWLGLPDGFSTTVRGGTTTADFENVTQAWACVYVQYVEMGDVRR